jgi:tetratricopeptide (TPR) repeat protein
MDISNCLKIAGLFLCVTLMVVTMANAGDNPKEYISFWKKNYAELKPENDLRAAKANEIFNRLVNVAGSRPGILLRLYITKTEPLNERLPISLPDGSVVVSKGDLDICYRDSTYGDDRLAFVLAHEIAHQLNNDFWHMNFFYAVEKYSSKGKFDLKEILGVTGEGEEDPKRLQSKELMADSQGIIYASMAGFNTSAVVMDDEKVNFFEEWIKAVDPTYLEQINPDSSHPTPKQRAEAIKARLNQVLDSVGFFTLGLLYYQASEYRIAASAFNEFLKFFPSREVYHDLAACYHQIGLKEYQMWKKYPFPFKLSMTLDPSTRATRGATRGKGANVHEALLGENIEKAIGLYQKAISSDPSYWASYNNLGCAFIMKEDAYKAVSTLQDAHMLKPDSAEVLNNLGVAYFYAENLAKAKEKLIKARNLEPAYSAPLFNLVKLAQREKKDTDVEDYCKAYLKLDPVGPWAKQMLAALSPKGEEEPVPTTVSKITESILGLRIGSDDEKVPPEWRKHNTKEGLLEGMLFRINTYLNRVITVSEDNKIKLIATFNGFVGKTAKGIAIGCTDKEVTSAYGAANQVLDLTQGPTWLYFSHGIAIQLRNNRVVSWVLF